MKNIESARRRFRKAVIVLCSISAACVMTGCSGISGMIDQVTGTKEECRIHEKDVTEFTYKGKVYTILQDTVSEKELGTWVGCIRKLAVLDRENNLIAEVDAVGSPVKDLAKVSEDNPEAAYTLSYGNVYLDKQDGGDRLIVGIDGTWHKAVAKELLKEKDMVFQVREYNTTEDTVSIAAGNCTEITYGTVVYQITEEVIPGEKVGTYLGMLAKNIVFDETTKRPLSRAELSRIDWTGKETAGQKRVEWFFGDVCAVSGTDTEEAVAVEINSEYRLAKAVR